MCFGKPLAFSNHFIYRIIQFPITFCLLFDVLRSSRNFFARIDGQDVLDSWKGLFYSPPPLTYSFSPRASSTSIQTFCYASIPSNFEKNEFSKGIPVGLNWWGNRSCLTARQITHAIDYA